MKTIIAVLFGCLALNSLAQVIGDNPTNTTPPGVTNATPTAPGDAMLTDPEVVVWLQDATPEGATVSGPPNEPWVWTNAFWDGSELVGPYSGTLMHVSPPGEGWQQHYFSLPGLDWAVNPGDLLIAYVYLPLRNTPAAVALRWLVGAASTPNYMTGEVAQAFYFDRTTDIRVPASPTLNVGTSNGFTVETWIYPDDLSSARPIVEWNSDNNGYTSYGAHFWTSQPTPYGSGPGCLYANLIDTGGGSHYFASAAGIVTNGGWQHVALTYNQTTGYGDLYLDGTVVAATHLGAFTPQTSYDLYFGARVCGAGAARWYGGIDEVSLYGGVLSGAQILAIYNAGSFGKCTGPDILIAPDAQSVAAGANVTFSVGATSATPMSYQ